MARGLAQAQAAAATAQAQLIAMQVPTATDTPTPTATSTPQPTSTPTLTPTPTATPASAAEWADRYLANTLEGLNTLSLLDFSPERAAALVQTLAQEAGMAFVPVSYKELSSEPWAAFVSPRTPDGTPLPMLFWRNTNGGNEVQGQLLTDVVNALGGSAERLRAACGRAQPGRAAQRSPGPLCSPHDRAAHCARGCVGLRVGTAPARRPLRADLAQQRRARMDLPRPRQPGQPWQTASASCPIFVSMAPCLPTAPLRTQAGIPGVFIEQPPFAGTRFTVRWQPALASDTDPNAPATLNGYRLAATEVAATPLTTLATFLGPAGRRVRPTAPRTWSRGWTC